MISILTRVWMELHDFHFYLVSGETRRGGEDKMLDDLERWVSKIYVSCIGENVAKINTIDMLHHIETRMEGLTQVLTNYYSIQVT